MQWAAAFEPNEKGLTRHIYLLGPVFYRDLSIREVREGLELYANAGADLKWRSELINVIGSIPVLSFAIFSRYAILLHNLLNSEQLSVTDLSGRDLPEGFIQAKKSEKPHDRHRVWQAETALLQMVKNGDIGYQEALANSIALSDGVPVHGRDPMRQAKTSAIVFTSIVVRAAIKGGLSPETAYSLGDSYIQAAEDSPGRLDDFYMGQILLESSATMQDLSDAIARVTKEEAAQAARALRLDTIYELQGVQA